MKKHLHSAGIVKVATELDYSEEGFSQVTIGFLFNADDLDEGQRELVKVVEKAVQQHLKPAEPNFDCYDKMLKGVNGFEWDKAFVSTQKEDETF